MVQLEPVGKQGMHSRKDQPEQQRGLDFSPPCYLPVSSPRVDVSRR